MVVGWGGWSVSSSCGGLGGITQIQGQRSLSTVNFFIYFRGGWGDLTNTPPPTLGGGSPRGLPIQLCSGIHVGATPNSTQHHISCNCRPPVSSPHQLCPALPPWDSAPPPNPTTPTPLPPWPPMCWGQHAPPPAAQPPTGAARCAIFLLNEETRHLEAPEGSHIAPDSVDWAQDPAPPGPRQVHERQ